MTDDVGSNNPSTPLCSEAEEVALVGVEEPVLMAAESEKFVEILGEVVGRLGREEAIINPQKKAVVKSRWKVMRGKGVELKHCVCRAVEYPALRE